MRMTRDNFKVLVERALSDINVTHLEPVIRKKLLHYDILYCLKHPVKFLLLTKIF